MEKGLAQNPLFRRIVLEILPVTLCVALALGTTLALGIIMMRAWTAMDASRTIAELERDVVRVTLNRDRLTQTLDRLKQKTADRPIVWDDVRDPF
jgi:hypothetical protein